MTTEDALGRQDDHLELVTTAARVLELVDLEKIITYEVHGVRQESDIPEGDARQEIEALARGEELWLETRFKLSFVTTHATYTADMSAMYTHTEPFQISDDAVQEFISKVGLFAVYPFLREAVYSMATRLDLPRPLLGLVKQGQMQFTAGEREMAPDE